MEWVEGKKQEFGVLEALITASKILKSNTGRELELLKNRLRPKEIIDYVEIGVGIFCVGYLIFKYLSLQ